MENYDQFEILEEVGHGGMGKVYKARHQVSGQLMALKVVKESVASDSRIVQRFQKEAQAAARLNHPNIVRTYGFGTVKGRLHIGMEFIHGVTLHERLHRKGPFKWREALYIALQVADALAYSHSSGIIHRDIKPQNILLTKDGTVKVLDFGIAKTMWDFDMGDVQEDISGGDPLMTVGQRLGTPIYMPPEQMRNEPIDGRADIYALGATLYEMLTGERPFISSDVKEILRQKEAQPYHGTALLKKKAPALVAQLVLQMLNPERTYRPRTASKLLQQIDEIFVEMDAIEKLRKRTARFSERILESLGGFFGKLLSKFLDFITEPQVIAWSIVLAVLALLVPLAAVVIRLVWGEIPAL